MHTEDKFIPADAAVKLPEAPAKVADLSELDSVAGSNAGTTVDLYDFRSGADLGIKISVLGRDSDAFKAKSHDQSRKKISKLQKGGFRPGHAPIDVGDKDGIELLAACTTGWTNMRENGVDVPFSEAAAIRIYTKYPWIKEQVDSAIGDRALFMKG